jgi:hypothetical protein
MSTRKDKTNSVIAEFQAVVEELRTRGMTDIDCHSLLNMIFQGWLVSGQPTQEYLNLATQAIQQREQEEQAKNNIVGINGEILYPTKKPNGLFSAPKTGQLKGNSRV